MFKNRITSFFIKVRTATDHLDTVCFLIKNRGKPNQACGVGGLGPHLGVHEWAQTDPAGDSAPGQSHQCWGGPAGLGPSSHWEQGGSAGTSLVLLGEV